MRLRVAFLNCYNLFPWRRPVGRGPKNAAQTTAKITGLCTTVRRVCSNRMPDLVGFCEVGRKHFARRIRTTLVAPALPYHSTLWSGLSSNRRDDTGLLLLYNPARLRLISGSEAFGPASAERRKWYAARFELLKASGGPLPMTALLAHWKSNRDGISYARSRREESAKEVGDLLRPTVQGSEPAIVFGDFNCEPCDDVFVKPKNALRAVRNRDWVTSAARTPLTYMYNPMWRHLGEPDDVERSVRARYRRPRPVGTFSRPGSRYDGVVWDQILVNRHALIQGAPLRLIESTVRIVSAAGGSSDHCAVGAEFEYD